MSDLSGVYDGAISQRFSLDVQRRLVSSAVTLDNLKEQKTTVQSETNFRWLQLIIFTLVLIALFGFYIYQRTTITQTYKDVIQFINGLRHSGNYVGPGTGYDWAWYFKYPRLAFSMPNISLPAAVFFGYYNAQINLEMVSNPSCVQEMYIMAQNRPQATAAQILCAWYMTSTGTTGTALAPICQNLCPPIEPYQAADFLNTSLNTTLQLTAASAELSGANPIVMGATFVGSLVLGISQASVQAKNQTADCQAYQTNCISNYPTVTCGPFG